MAVLVKRNSDEQITSKQQDSSFRVEVTKALICYGEVYSREVTPGLIATYAEVLKGYEERTILRAMKDCLTRCKFFPVPAEIVERYAEIQMARSRD